MATLAAAGWQRQKRWEGHGYSMQNKLKTTRKPDLKLLYLARLLLLREKTFALIEVTCQRSHTDIATCTYMCMHMCINAIHTYRRIYSVGLATPFHQQSASTTTISIAQKDINGSTFTWSVEWTRMATLFYYFYFYFLFIIHFIFLRSLFGYLRLSHTTWTAVLLLILLLLLLGSHSRANLSLSREHALVCIWLHPAIIGGSKIAAIGRSSV